jgi:hypothetical protein
MIAICESLSSGQLKPRACFPVCLHVCLHAVFQTREAACDATFGRCVLLCLTNVGNK